MTWCSAGPIVTTTEAKPNECTSAAVSVCNDVTDHENMECWIVCCTFS